MAEKKKINWLLILQAWAMLWVVIGHSSLVSDNRPEWDMTLVSVAYMFHMQLFVMISGYLFKITRLDKTDKWKYKETIKDKAVRLGVPGLFFSLIAIVIKSFFPGEMNRPVDLSLGGGITWLSISL